MEFRCQHCDKLLAHIDDLNVELKLIGRDRMIVEIKCPRCRQINTVTLKD